MPEIKMLQSGKLICLETTSSMQERENLFHQILDYLKSRKVSPKGERMVILYDDPRTLDRASTHYAAALELGGEAPGDGELTIVIQSAMRVVSEVHRGPTAQLPEIYGRLYQWIEEKGFEISGHPREFELGGPQADSENAAIEIQIPVARRE